METKKIDTRLGKKLLSAAIIEDRRIIEVMLCETI